MLAAAGFRAVEGQAMPVSDVYAVQGGFLCNLEALEIPGR